MKGCFKLVMYLVGAFFVLVVLVSVFGDTSNTPRSTTTSRSATTSGRNSNSAPQPTATPQPSKASISSHPQVIKQPGYVALFREIAEGTPIIVKGEMLQKQSTWGNTILRVAVTENGSGDTVWYSDDVYVECAADGICDDLLEDDIVEMYGFTDGREEYTTVMGAQREIPRIKVYHIDIVGHLD